MRGPEIRSVLERAERFLNLAALTSVLLAAAAIALAARRYLQRHLDGCAMMRCLGASQARITRLYVLHFTMLGSLAAVLGMMVGVAAQAILAVWLTEVVAVPLPLPGLVPALHGVVIGLLLLLGFALPPLINLGQVPTLRVLRRELGLPKGGGMHRICAWVPPSSADSSCGVPRNSASASRCSAGLLRRWPQRAFSRGWRCAGSRCCADGAGRGASG